MDKYGVDKEKKRICPRCGCELKKDKGGICDKCGSEPLEKGGEDG